MTTSDDTARLIETEFEMNEQVFVPAGDGEPAQWKQKGDLQLGEFNATFKARWTLWSGRGEDGALLRASRRGDAKSRRR